MGNDALHKRAFSMEKRIERMRTTDKPTREKKMTAQFRSSEFLGDEVLTLKGVGKSFGEQDAVLRRAASRSPAASASRSSATTARESPRSSR